MKRILVTGADSFIGTSFLEYMKNKDGYSVEIMDMLDGAWRKSSFAGFDAVFHVAGIAHIKESPENAPLYYEINRDLAAETARKAKSEGVAHFVFISTVGVYGVETGVITPSTPLMPKTNYGKSKLQAEGLINALAGEGFTVTVIRPPLVYGNGCKGNYSTLERLAMRLPVFPRVKNRRSMIYVGNLCECVKTIIDSGRGGLVCPDDPEYIVTSELLRLIARINGRRVFLEPVSGTAVRLFMPFSKTLRKAFGSLVYGDMGEHEIDCLMLGLRESLAEMYGGQK